MPHNLKTYNNPDSRKNWVITAKISSPEKITLRFVPDKLIADHNSLKIFIIEYLEQTWASPEEMLLKIIEAINNELVPRWVEVIYEKEGITLKVDDTQPRLKPFQELECDDYQPFDF